MHLEKVMLVQQDPIETKEQAAKRRKTNRERVEETRALETEEQTAKCRNSNRECVVETCTCMVSTATICMYRYGTYPGLRGSVPQILYLLHKLTRGLLGQGKGIVGQLGTLLSCTTLCCLS